jgi:hypothetical protein
MPYSSRISRRSLPSQLLLRVPLLGTSHSNTICSCPWVRSAPAAQHLPISRTPTRHHTHACATRSALPMNRSYAAAAHACCLTRAPGPLRTSLPTPGCSPPPGSRTCCAHTCPARHCSLGAARIQHIRAATARCHTSSFSSVRVPPRRELRPSAAWPACHSRVCFTPPVHWACARLLLDRTTFTSAPVPAPLAPPAPAFARSWARRAPRLLLGRAAVAPAPHAARPAAACPRARLAATPCGCRSHSAHAPAPAPHAPAPPHGPLRVLAWALLRRAARPHRHPRTAALRPCARRPARCSRQPRASPPPPAPPRSLLPPAHTPHGPLRRPVAA